MLSVVKVLSFLGKIDEILLNSIEPHHSMILYCDYWSPHEILNTTMQLKAIFEMLLRCTGADPWGCTGSKCTPSQK